MFRDLILMGWFSAHLNVQKLCLKDLVEHSGSVCQAVWTSSHLWGPTDGLKGVVGTGPLVQGLRGVPGSSPPE